METAGLTVMDETREHQSALAAAGYTDTRGAVVFCLLLAAVGALVGSVVLAILWNILMPGSPEALSTAVGALAGAVIAVAVGVAKIRRGNLEAREQVEDREWRRLVRRRHGEGRRP